MFMVGVTHTSTSVLSNNILTLEMRKDRAAVLAGNGSDQGTVRRETGPVNSVERKPIRTLRAECCRGLSRAHLPSRLSRLVGGRMATKGGVMVWTGTARDQSAHGVSNDVGSVQGTHGDPLPGWFSANGDHIHVLELRIFGIIQS